MSVYTSAFLNASDRASPGCRCHGRKPAYPSDLTNAEWAVLEGEARAVMAELVVATGRPMVHDLRAVLDAIGYVTRHGIEWWALPVDFPPYEAVYTFFLRWSGRGLPERLAGRLRGRLRVMAGRSELPTAECIDSQTVKAAETVGAAARGTASTGGVWWMNRPATLAQKSWYSQVYIRKVCQPMSTCSDGPRPAPMACR
ncbi:transposase [Streptosporangium sp. NPDC002544]|uniref:transposase n=1 Tax=Streptosporangium sp. NPDC002544 TaxID=3154538 RepID=UPI0033185514